MRSARKKYKTQNQKKKEKVLKKMLLNDAVSNVQSE